MPVTSALEAALSASGSATDAPGPPAPSMTTAFSFFDPMTAPRPPRAAARMWWSGVVTSTAAALQPISPAGPVQMRETLSPYSSRRRSTVSNEPRPSSSGAGTSLPPSSVITSTERWSAFPVTLTARSPSSASARAAEPPELASLMPPVRGLLPPTESRPPLGTTVPAKIPAAYTMTLPGPSESASASTSRSTMAEVKPRPPSGSRSALSGSRVTVPCVRSTLRRSVTVAHVLSRGESVALARPPAPVRPRSDMAISPI